MTSSTAAAPPPSAPEPAGDPSGEPAGEPAGEPVTPTELVAGVRAARAAADAAEVEVYTLALAWADAHPPADGDPAWHAAKTAKARRAQTLQCWLEEPVPTDLTDPRNLTDLEDLEWFGIPAVAWHAPAAFAAANAMSTTAGKAFLRDALVVRHRLPMLHARVVAGRVPVWRARLVAQAVLGQPADVVERVDAALAVRGAVIGTLALDKLVKALLIELHAEAVELASYLALDARHATLHPGTVNHTGIAEFTIRAELPDLQDLDHTLTRLAAAIAAAGGVDARESLQVRRALAVGIIADPQTAHALLQQTAQTEQTATEPAAEPATEPATGPARESGPAATADPAVDPSARTGRRVELVVHFSEDAVRGTNEVLTHPAQHTVPGPLGQALLATVIRQWCTRPGTQIIVRPVIDLAEQIVTDAYRPTATQQRLIQLRDRTCVFPHCTRPAAACDTDHAHPFDDTGPPGQTHTHGLVAECRHHHRLKTHAGWRLRILTPGTYLWSDPHDQLFLRTPDGATHHLTDP